MAIRSPILSPISSPAANPFGGVLGGATWYWQFAQKGTEELLRPPLSVTRASTKHVFNAQGNLESVAANTLGFTHDPVTLESLGALIEGARTNLCTNYNANPDAALTNVVKSGDAAATLTRVDDSSALATAGLSGVCTSGFAFRLDNSSGAANAFATIQGGAGNTNQHTASVYIRTNGTECRLQIESTAGSTATTKAAYERETFSASPAAAGNKFLIVATPGAVATFVLNQFEEGAFASSPIVTAGASATRAADVVTYPLGPEFNSGEGTVLVKYRFDESLPTGGHQMLFDLALDASNRVRYRYLDTGFHQFQVDDGGVSQVSSASASAAPSTGADTTVVVGWKASDFAFAAGGTILGTDTSGTVPSGLTTLYLGSNLAGGEPFFGTISELAYRSTKLGDAQIQALSGQP